MEENDYNLNDKINIIYEYLYNNANKKCFTIDKIKLGEIGLSNIKLSIPEENITQFEFGNFEFIRDES